MKLYKYMTYESALKFLSYGSIRLTARQCLNDPFEILTPGNIKKKYNNRIDPEKFQEYLDFSGVISLTETKDNLLMWSHYAKEHTGVVIEFQINELEPYSLFNMNPYLTKDRFFQRFITEKLGIMTIQTISLILKTWLCIISFQNPTSGYMKKNSDLFYHSMRQHT